MAIRKWYFAINENGLLNAFDQVNAAVVSARKNTSLQPICLVDNTEVTGLAASRLSSLKAGGVTIVQHTSSYYKSLHDHFGDAVVPYSGHWLRCDIPQIETEDEFVFYSDIDVVFLSDPAEIQDRPAFIACAPEHHQRDISYFNSGVMVMNLRGLRETEGDLRSTVMKRLPTMNPHDDQGALNECYRYRWDKLPNAWNWKPYWGVNDNAKLIHYHGPKPAHIKEMIGGAVSKFGDDYETIFKRSPEAYRHYLKVFESV